MIDNEPLTIDADNLWINLNYHLMHFVDFMPAANWSTHQADPLLQMFERLSSLLDRAGQRQAQVEVVVPRRQRPPRLAKPAHCSAGSPACYPQRSRSSLPANPSRNTLTKAGHDLAYQLDWGV